uniref:Putative secreted protein n=1 Tax=Anopheles darlingi TaxID=43151 RepID=A0A2M4D3J0_ANODA
MVISNKLKYSNSYLLLSWIFDSHLLVMFILAEAFALPPPPPLLHPTAGETTLLLDATTPLRVVATAAVVALPTPPAITVEVVLATDGEALPCEATEMLLATPPILLPTTVAAIDDATLLGTDAG